MNYANLTQMPMPLHNFSSQSQPSVSGSLIDRIGSTLFQKAQNQELGVGLGFSLESLPNLPIVPLTINVSPPMSTSASTLASGSSPAESETSAEHSPVPVASLKRSGSPLTNDIDIKRSLKLEEDSDMEPSDELNYTVSMSPMLEGIGKWAGTPNPDAVFVTVPGRLSVLTSTHRYTVTIGEVQRRLGNPENLNASLLGAIMRRAKSKNGGRELRATLESLGMPLPSGRRKKAQLTLFTSLSEGEAEHLASDFVNLCGQEFPATDLARHMVMAYRNENREAIQKRKMELRIAQKVMNEMVGFLSDSSPDVQHSIEQFQLLSHNFGTAALKGAYSTFDKYVTSQIDILTQLEQKPVAPPQPKIQLGLIPQAKMLQMLFSQNMNMNMNNINLAALLQLAQQNST